MKAMLRLVSDLETIFVLGPLHLGVLALIDYATALVLGLRCLQRGYHRTFFSLHEDSRASKR